MTKMLLITALALCTLSCNKKKDELPDEKFPEKFTAAIIHKETAYGGHTVKDQQYTGNIYATVNNTDTTITISSFRDKPVIFKIDYNTINQEPLLATPSNLSGHLKYYKSAKTISIYVYDGARKGVDYSTAEGKAVE